MKIDLIELYYVRIPLDDRKPGFFAEPRYFSPSWIPGFRQSEMRFYLLKLGSDAGYEGYAATPAMGLERKSLGAILGNYLMGINPLDIGLVNQRIQEFSYIGMRNGWIDAAFWDLAGKIRGEPLWKMLGGSGGRVAPYLSSGSTHGHEPARIREVARRALDDGFQGLKIRVKSMDLEAMTDFVGAARDALGNGVELMVDANQGWPVDLLDETPRWDAGFALEFARRIEAHHVEWLEEPLNRGDFAGLAALRAQTATPIAGGELNASWTEFKTLLDMGCLDIYQPDAVMAGGTYAGGISVVYWLIREIRERNRQTRPPAEKIRFCPHTWTTGLGFALALQLVGVLPETERQLLEYPLEGHWRPQAWARFIRGGFERDADGMLAIPDRPGLGVELDWGVIRRFGKRVYRGTPANVSLRALADRGLKQALYLKKKRAEQLDRSARAQFSIPPAPF